MMLQSVQQETGTVKYVFKVYNQEIWPVCYIYIYIYKQFCERNTCQSEEPEDSVSLAAKLKHSIKTINHKNRYSNDSKDVCSRDQKTWLRSAGACFSVRDPLRFRVIHCSGKCGYGILQWICWNDILTGNVIMIRWQTSIMIVTTHSNSQDWGTFWIPIHFSTAQESSTLWNQFKSYFRYNMGTGNFHQ